MVLPNPRMLPWLHGDGIQNKAVQIDARRRFVESIISAHMTSALCSYCRDHRRAGEAALTSVDDILTMLVDALCGLHLLAHGDISFCVFGHELGALLAFEFVRRVQEEFPADALFVSGLSCPQVQGARCPRCRRHFCYCVATHASIRPSAFGSRSYQA